MTGHRTTIKGYALKDGKLIKSNRHKDISARLRERGSKKVRVVRKPAT